MNVGIVLPPGAPRRSGNRVSAVRWQRMLRSLGHRAAVVSGYDGRQFDLLVVLHARLGAAAARTFRDVYPRRPLIVALTGTDLYLDFQLRAVQTTLRLTDRLVVLQPAALRALPRGLRAKAVVIYQSVERVLPVHPHRRDEGTFDVAVVAGLRAVKDPLRAAYAARLLPRDSKIRITAVGPPLDPRFAAAAEREVRVNPRYRWIGEVGAMRARRIVAGSDALVLSSRAEGGANVIGEAAVAATPVLCTRIDGTVGLLGKTYPGYFPVGDTAALAALFARFERESRFRETLRKRMRAVAPLFSPGAERRTWARLLKGLREVRSAGRELR